MSTSDKEAALGVMAVVGGCLMAGLPKAYRPSLLLLTALGGAGLAALAGVWRVRRRANSRVVKGRRLNLAHDDAINFHLTRRRHILAVSASETVHHRFWKGSHVLVEESWATGRLRTRLLPWPGATRRHSGSAPCCRSSCGIPESQGPTRVRSSRTD